MSAAPHVLIVGPCDECTGPTDEHPNGYRCDRPNGYAHHVQLAVECPGIDLGACAGWTECDHPDLPPLAAWDGDEEPTAHGVEHQYVEGVWGHQTGRCYLQEFIDLREAAEPLNLRPCEGRVPVHQTYEGDGYTVLERAS